MISQTVGFFLDSKKIFVLLYFAFKYGLDIIFKPTPIIKNFLLFNVISSCNIPQIFFSLTRTSFGHLKDILFFSQKCPITSDIITGLIIENSLNGG